MHLTQRIEFRASAFSLEEERERTGEAGESLGVSASFLLHTDHIVDLMNNSILGNNITFCYACILHLGAAITVQLQPLLVNGLDGADERPVGLDDSGAADDVRHDVRPDDVLQLFGVVHRLVVPLLDLEEDVVFGHENGEALVGGVQEVREVGLLDQC